MKKETRVSLHMTQSNGVFTIVESEYTIAPLVGDYLAFDSSNEDGTYKCRIYEATKRLFSPDNILIVTLKENSL